jgi:hypothetical protein
VIIWFIRARLRIFGDTSPRDLRHLNQLFHA